MSESNCIEIFNAALLAADPGRAVNKTIHVKDSWLEVSGSPIDFLRFNRVIAVGAGKATAAMAGAVEDLLGPKLDEGLIIVKYGHTRALKKIKQREASHPLPDEDGMSAANEVIELVRRADERTLVLCLLSGGASSLLVSPVDGVTLEDKKEITELLLKSGAAIHELNAVRKHLSKVKGGWLARIASPATVVTLALSDVLGDRLDVIASGPTVPDTTTFSQALDVLGKYGLKGRSPRRAVRYLEWGASGREPETPKPGDPSFDKTVIAVVGGLKQSLLAASEAAEQAGFEAQIVTDQLQGEAKYAARFLAQKAREVKQELRGSRRVCLISGGETTVAVKGDGKGGRNQELALAFAEEIKGVKGLTLLSAGTDGTDGPTDAAGAVVNGETAKTAEKIGMDPAPYLANNDSYHFFQKLDSATGAKHHLFTGPTGTNVMDVQIMLIEAGPSG